MSTTTLPQPAVLSNGIADDDLYEIIDGKRVGLPPMGLFSVWLASEIYAELRSYVRAQNLGRAITEALFHLPPPIGRDRRPDVAFVSYDRWPKNRPLPPTDNAWDVVPNLTVEVVSPTDTVGELQEKIEEYFRAGVQAVWVVYPPQKKIYVHQSPTQVVGLALNDVLGGGDVVPGFRLPLADLFGQPAENGAVS
jgi:Uma2 family endonuclease